MNLLAKSQETLTQINKDLEDKTLSFEQRNELVEKYDNFLSYYYKLKTTENSLEVDILDSQVLSLSQKYLQFQKDELEEHWFYSLHLRFHQTFKKYFSLFLMTLIFFCISVIFGYILGNKFPDEVHGFIGPHMTETIVSGEKWFESLNNSPMMGSLSIMINNIKVCLFAYSLGAIFGIGGFFILVYNGLLIGVVMGFCKVHGLNEALMEFISAHGPLEITIIIVSCFCSFIYGRAFYIWDKKEREIYLSNAIKDSIIVIILSSFWLILAGFVEGFLSPRTDITQATKLLVGTLLAAVFWIICFFYEPRKKTIKK